MWMAELASRSGLSVPTIKYYLREGLLHPGETVGATRAQYDETHLRRLRLIRALTDVAGLRLEVVGEVLEGVEHAESWHEAVGSAHTRLPFPGTRPAGEASRARVEAMLDRAGWSLSPGSPHAEALGRALDALDDIRHPISDTMLDAYAAAWAPVAALEVAGADSGDVESSAEAAVVGTLLQEPVVLAVRRIAQENASRERGR